MRRSRGFFEYSSRYGCIFESRRKREGFLRWCMCTVVPKFQNNGVSTKKAYPGVCKGLTLSNPFWFPAGSTLASDFSAFFFWQNSNFFAWKKSTSRSNKRPNKQKSHLGPGPNRHAISGHQILRIFQQAEVTKGCPKKNHPKKTKKKNRENGYLEGHQLGLFPFQTA